MSLQLPSKILQLFCNSELFQLATEVLSYKMQILANTANNFQKAKNNKNLHKLKKNLQK